MNFSISITQMVVAALVSVTISGFVGAAISRFLDRAKLTVKVSSMKFTGKTIKLPDRAVELSANNPWNDSLPKFINYAALVDAEQELSILIERLGKARELVSDWLNENPLESSKPLLPINELKRVPYFIDNSIGQSIVGSLKRREFPDLPNSIEVISELEGKLEVQKYDGEWVLHLGSSGSRFPFDSKDFGDRERDAMKLLATSFSVGDIKNIRKVLESVGANFTRELDVLSSLREILRSTLVEQSRPKFNVVILNRGKASATVGSYFVVEFSVGSVVERVLGQAAAVGTAKSDENDGEISHLLGGLKGEGQNESGREFYVEPFLSGASSSSFIIVEGGSSVSMEVECLTNIGDMEKLENGLFEKFSSGYIEARVVCFDEGGVAMQSSKAEFGRRITEERAAFLLENS